MLAENRCPRFQPAVRRLRHSATLRITSASTVPAMKNSRPLRRALTSSSWPSRLRRRASTVARKAASVPERAERLTACPAGISSSLVSDIALLLRPDAAQLSDQLLDRERKVLLGRLRQLVARANRPR